MSTTTAPAPAEHVTALYIDDNGRTVCAAHAGGYLTAAIESAPNAPMHFTPLGSWVRATEPTGYGCEDCGATIPGPAPEVLTRDNCPDMHVDAVVGETYEWSYAGESATVTVESIIGDEHCRPVLVAPVGGGGSFVTDTCCLRATVVSVDFDHEGTTYTAWVNTAHEVARATLTRMILPQLLDMIADASRSALSELGRDLDAVNASGGALGYVTLAGDTHPASFPG